MFMLLARWMSLAVRLESSMRSESETKSCMNFLLLEWRAASTGLIP